MAQKNRTYIGRDRIGLKVTVIAQTHIAFKRRFLEHSNLKGHSVKRFDCAPN